MNKWKKVKLGKQLKRIRTGKLDANASSENGIYPFFTCSVFPLKIGTYSYDCECVLVAGNGDLNVKYYNGKFDAYQRTYILEVLDKNILNTRYFYYFMKDYIDILRTKTKGGVIKYIRLNDIADAEIPLPAMEEQKKIAARLDAVSDLLAKQKQLLSEQDNLIQSLFYDMFLKQNFSKRKIVDFVETDVKNAKKIFNKNNFIKYIDISSIDNNSNIITGYTHIEFCDAPSRAQQVVKKNDILVSTVRPNLKNIALIKFNDNNLVASSGFCVLRAKNIEPVFLLYNVLSQDFTEKMVSAVTGANYPAIKNSDILNYKIPVPPLELQEKFAAIVEQIESEKSKIKSAIAETQTLFNALMSEYFEE